MNSDNHCPDVFAIIVTFNPCLDVLTKLMSELLPQVGHAMIVDNGSTVDVSGWFAQGDFEAVELRLLGWNSGIAAAQNVGLAEARQRGARFIVLSDQDSLPAPDMVSTLRSAAVQMIEKGRKVAAVGPRYLDTRQDNPPPFIQVKGLRVERQWCREPDSIVEVDYLIASGCFIPMEAIEQVGPMKEELFIDYVDIEWGLRAKQRGYQSFGVCAAAMAHSLGDAPIGFMGRWYPSHAPIRHYYHFRNAVWLYRQAYIPLHWKFADGLRLVRKYVFYSLFAKPHLAHLSMMSRGIVDALRSRLGQVSQYLD